MQKRFQSTHIRSKNSFSLSYYAKHIGLLFIGAIFIILFIYSRNDTRSNIPIERVSSVEIRDLHSLSNNVKQQSNSIHTIYEDQMRSDNCKIDTESFSGTLIESEKSISYDINLSQSSWKYYQLCFSSSDLVHDQFILSIDLVSSVGDCDMYLSASEPYPSSSSWDWRSIETVKKDELRIESFAREFTSTTTQRSHALYIGITAQSQGPNICKLSLLIHDYDEYEVVHRVSPMLRGQILLPRDVDRIKRGQSGAII